MSKQMENFLNCGKKTEVSQIPTFIPRSKQHPRLTVEVDMKVLRETGSTNCPTPKNNQKLHPEDFIFLKMLGKGKFGNVFLAMHKETGFILAIKVINKSILYGMSEEQNKKTMNQLIRQLKIQMFLQHPNLISLYSFFQDSQSVYLMMQVGCDGQLYQMMAKRKRFSEESISFLMREILRGVNFMHKNCVIHRDLKPENIVILHGVPKICDFGWAVHCPKEFRSTLCGTPLYLSPQILKGDFYNQKIDTWAIGTLAYELLNGDNPFKITKKSEIIKIVTDQLSISRGSPTIKQFIQQALMKDPKIRPDSSKMLSHYFIEKYKELETCEELCTPIKRKSKYISESMTRSWRKPQ